MEGVLVVFFQAHPVSFSGGWDMKFLKVHGLGNDFILVDAREEKDLPAAAEGLAELAVKVCDRNFGIGADGLVLIREADDADIYMQIINSDGSAAEMCGNAIRCAAGYMYERGEIRENILHVKTLAGIKVPEIIARNGREVLVRVDMGEPVLERQRIPMLGEPGAVIGEPLQVEGHTFKVTAVSMGNPHCVIFTDDVEAVPLAAWGPKIEAHPAFPRKTNVEFVQVLDREEINMRVWERGAGPTLACGTGACASVVAGVLNNLTARKVRVNLRAGALQIEWCQGDNRVYMTGPAEIVYSGEYLL
jgi:diaminopimelate epimerase